MNLKKKNRQFLKSYIFGGGGTTPKAGENSRVGWNPHHSSDRQCQILNHWAATERLHFTEREKNIIRIFKSLSGHPSTKPTIETAQWWLLERTFVWSNCSLKEPPECKMINASQMFTPKKKKKRKQDCFYFIATKQVKPFPPAENPQGATNSTGRACVSYASVLRKRKFCRPK